jgi:hypothetical protein
MQEQDDLLERAAPQNVSEISKSQKLAMLTKLE